MPNSVILPIRLGELLCEVLAIACLLAHAVPIPLLQAVREPLWNVDDMKSLVDPKALRPGMHAFPPSQSCVLFAAVHYW